MSLVWRSLMSSAIVAGIVLTFSGCKSGGGWWAPSMGKWGASSSTSDLAVSRPTTKVPTPSSGATPSTPGSLASSSSAPGAQDGPYGSSADRTSTSSAYGTRPAGWQNDPHSAVAPAGGYQTGGPYSMASRQSQPGVTPGAYSQPYGGPSGNRVAAADATGGSSDPSAGAYAGAGAYGGGAADAIPASPLSASDAAAGSIYPDTGAASAYDPTSAAASGAVPPSDAPGAISEPAATSPTGDDASVYGSGAAYGSQDDAANPAATGTTSTESPPVISNPYSLSAPARAGTRPPTSPTPTTAPASSTAPFSAPTLPSSLTAAPGSYRPGSTASPGSSYGAGASYDSPTTASGTGYSTIDGTMLR